MDKIRYLWTNYVKIGQKKILVDKLCWSWTKKKVVDKLFRN